MVCLLKDQNKQMMSPKDQESIVLIYTATSTPIGDYVLVASDKALLMVDPCPFKEEEVRKHCKRHFSGPLRLIKQEQEPSADTEEELTHHHDASAILQSTVSQLSEYFSGGRSSFDVPLHLIGTEFQQQVWNALQEIPFGKTCSYKDIANRLGSPRAYRAVGMANNKNPISIIVPCHRVIGSDGSMVGYGGPGDAQLDKKRFLLDLEKNRRNRE